jgi:hypothetical protein
VYNWAHTPIGLVDRTMISFSWSITSQPAPVARRLLGSWARESNPSPGVLVLSRMHPLGLFSSNATHTALHHVASKQVVALPAVRSLSGSNATRGRSATHTALQRVARKPPAKQPPAKQPPAKHTPMLPAARRMASRQASTPMLPAVRRMPSAQANSTKAQALHRRVLAPGTRSPR